MEIEMYRHRNKHYPVEAIQVTKSNQNDVAKWCGGTTQGRQSKKVVILSKKDGLRTVPVDWWVIKIYDSYLTLKDSTFWIIFETDEKYKIRMAEKRRLYDNTTV